MGIENRDYYRGSRYGGLFRSDGVPRIVKQLIIANIVVFLLQILVVHRVTSTDRSELDDLYGTREAFINEYVAQKELEQRQEERRWKKRLEADTPSDGTVRNANDSAPVQLTREELTEEAEDAYEVMFEQVHSFDDRRASVIQDWFELDTKKVLKGQLWRLVTCAFCHDRNSIFHILFNMLFLYWFGEILERMYGPREFLLFYFIAAIVASLAKILLDLYTRTYIPAIGASGAVMGVFMLFVCHFPHHQLRVYFFIPLEARWVLLFYLAYDLHPVLRTLSGERVHTGIAHAAHLGGLAFGYFYYRNNLRLYPYWQSLRQLRLPAIFGTRSLSGPTPPRDIIPFPVAEDHELDAILQKIHEQGRESLTDAELAKLIESSKRLRGQ